MSTRPAVFSWAALLALSAAIAHGADKSATKSFDPNPVVALLELVIGADDESAIKCLDVLTSKIQNGEITDESLESLESRLRVTLQAIIKEKGNSPLFAEAASLAASLRQPKGIAAARSILTNTKIEIGQRLSVLESLLFVRDAAALATVSSILSDAKDSSPELRAGVLQKLGRSEDPKVAMIVLAGYAKLEPDLKPKAIELLTQRVSWSKSLLEAIGSKRIPATALNANQVRKLLASRDKELRKLVIARWGTIRTERNPQREQVIVEMRNLLERQPGNPHKGVPIFNKVCGQCHKIYGKGEDVGPEITANGRASFEQLLSNVFDPSLVIGAAYQAQTVITADGRVLTGLVVEDNDQRIVLKLQGGKRETIPRDDVDEVHVSKLSLMPEGLEKQLSQQELVDLIAYLLLDKPPSDSKARWISGTPATISGN